MEMPDLTVIVTDDRYGSYTEEEEVLSSIGARLEVKQLASEAEAISALQQADGILNNLFPMTARVIESLQRCKVISRYGVGVDNVDIEAATRKRIWVARVPDYSIEEVSDQALALLLGCIRKIAYKDRKVREGKWNLHKDQPAHRIAGKTLGLVGFGAIARCLRRKVTGLGLSQVLVYDPYVPAEAIEKAGCASVQLSKLLAESDYISVHVPVTPQTKGLIGEREIAAMKTDAILVNTSRGPVIDESALGRALADHRLAGAGLDVFEKEPLPPGSILRTLDTVILSDHTGWYSEESVVELKTKAARNVASVLRGGAPVYPVNSL
jgi:D-3-phosphoglycerate dehydrogenase / 2-oxoglutarate reductase